MRQREVGSNPWPWSQALRPSSRDEDLLWSRASPASPHFSFHSLRQGARSPSHKPLVAAARMGGDGEVSPSVPTQPPFVFWARSQIPLLRPSSRPSSRWLQGPETQVKLGGGNLGPERGQRSEKATLCLRVAGH